MAMRGTWVAMGAMLATVAFVQIWLWNSRRDERESERVLTAIAAYRSDGPSIEARSALDCASPSSSYLALAGRRSTSRRVAPAAPSGGAAPQAAASAAPDARPIGEAAAGSALRPPAEPPEDGPPSGTTEPAREAVTQCDVYIAGAVGFGAATRVLVASRATGHGTWATVGEAALGYTVESASLAGATLRKGPGQWALRVGEGAPRAKAFSGSNPPAGRRAGDPSPGAVPPQPSAGSAPAEVIVGDGESTAVEAVRAP